MNPIILISLFFGLAISGDISVTKNKYCNIDSYSVTSQQKEAYDQIKGQISAAGTLPAFEAFLKDSSQVQGYLMAVGPLIVPWAFFLILT
jgi:hypothetical protein